MNVICRAPPCSALGCICLWRHLRGLTLLAFLPEDQRHSGDVRWIGPRPPRELAGDPVSIHRGLEVPPRHCQGPFQQNLGGGGGSPRASTEVSHATPLSHEEWSRSCSKRS